MRSASAAEDRAARSRNASAAARPALFGLPDAAPHREASGCGTRELVANVREPRRSAVLAAVLASEH